MTKVAIVLVMLGLVVTLLPAADGPASDKPEPGALKKKDKAGARDDALPKPEEGAPDDKTKELLGRVAKNMGTSEDRLKNRDPGKTTQEIQDQIVKDLDELIKKSQEQNEKDCNCQQSSSQSSSGTTSSQGSKSQARRRAQKNGNQPKQESGQQNASAKKDGQEKKDQAASDKKDASAKKDGQGKKDQGTAANKKDGKDKQGKDASASASSGGGDSSAKKKNTVADLFRDVWGHLPENKRQEMDAYSRERFMPRYDELLRQYYRTLSEQSRRKDGD